MQPGVASNRSENSLLKPPARQQVTKRIREGESVVWVPIGSGEAAQDVVAEVELRIGLARQKKELKMREVEVILAQQEFGMDTKVALRLGFRSEGRAFHPAGRLTPRTLSDVEKAAYSPHAPGSWSGLSLASWSTTTTGDSRNPSATSGQTTWLTVASVRL